MNLVKQTDEGFLCYRRRIYYVLSEAPPLHVLGQVETLSYWTQFCKRSPLVEHLRDF